MIEELSKEKDAIENEFGEKLDWQFLPNKNASRIALDRQDSFLNKEEDWDNYVEWIINNLQKFYNVFHKRLNNL